MRSQARRNRLIQCGMIFRKRYKPTATGNRNRFLLGYTVKRKPGCCQGGAFGVPFSAQSLCMFSLISGLPSYAVGITATGDITSDDYTDVLQPALQKAASEWKGINMLFVLQTDLKNFSPGAWLQDLKINAAYFFKWNKLAVVDHYDALKKLTAVFNLVAPGEAKTFTAEQVEEAKEWVSTP